MLVFCGFDNVTEEFVEESCSFAFGQTANLFLYSFISLQRELLLV